MVSPTGTSFGRLDPGRLNPFDENGTLIEGDRPTKEMPLHVAFFDTRSTVMLANHGPVVAGKDVEAACNAIEELEDTARLALLTRGLSPKALSDDQVRALVTKFDVEWDT